MSDIEKLSEDPQVEARDEPVSKSRRILQRVSCLGILYLFCFFIYSNYRGCSKLVSKYDGMMRSNSGGGLCPVTEKVDPKNYVSDLDILQVILHDEEFKNKSLQVLSKAIEYRTELFDNTIGPEAADTLEELYKLEPRWKNFEEFHKFLESSFPLVYRHLKVEKINKFALVYTWEGSDSSKKPIMLTAHMDVVPIQEDTLDQWTYPPYKGVYDGEFLYGRGVSDCKNLLIGLLETIELLLSESKFHPERTILLAFGYDEESVGKAAKEIFAHLYKRYGENSLLQIIDEGDEAFVDLEGLKMIIPATSEKGHLDSLIELFTPGGHSSVPPDHTSIGILAKLIDKIEDDPFESILTNANPILSFLQCIAEHSSSIDTSLKKDIIKAHLDVNANKRVIDYLSKDKANKYMITTSQAVDIINGGVKSNALPEHVSLLINHRIAVEESVKSTSDKVIKHVFDIAKKFDLGVIFNGEEIIKPTENGYFNYTSGSPFEPAPLTPSDGPIWDLFGGSLRYLYEDLIFPNDTDTFIFAPHLSTGNTDTRSYWALSRNIFRYLPGLPFEGSNIHSIDEKLLFESHFHIIAFYYYYLQVIDKIKDPLE